MKKLISTAVAVAAVAVPAAPAPAADGPIVRTEECPEGMVGRTIHIGDNTSVRNCYRLP